MSSFSYREYRPDHGLRHAVHRAWLATSESTIDDFLVVPDACVDVLFSINGCLQLVGTMTTAVSLSLPAGTDVVGLRLQPGAAAPWLRVNLADLTNEQVALRDVLGPAASALEERLRAIEIPRDRAIALCQEVSSSLARRWAETTEQEQALRRALAAMARAEGDISVEWLALHCNLSARQFQRRCQAATGLAPKLLARVLRLMRVLRQRRDTRANWTTVAADCGFADQAHFTHDFIDLVGCSPGAYSRRRGDVRFSQVDDTSARVESPALTSLDLPHEDFPRSFPQQD